jgi:CheY-like chemotaxis protein
LRNQTVLIVEDDDSIRAITSEVLESEGVEVIEAKNGREAITQLLDGVVPSVILLDLMMPGFNGWEFMEAKKKDQRIANIPVIIFTAMDGTRDFLIQDAADLIRKPVDLHVLYEVVKKYCQEH